MACAATNALTSRNAIRAPFLALEEIERLVLSGRFVRVEMFHDFDQVAFINHMAADRAAAKVVIADMMWG